MVFSPPPPPQNLSIDPALPAALIAPLSLAVYQNPAWVSWVVALLYSNLAFHDGHYAGQEGAFRFLDDAEAATKTLPAWTLGVIWLRRAFVLERESRYREAIFWLRCVEKAVREGSAHPAALSRVRLIRAKIRYTQSRYTEAEHFVSLPSGEYPCPHRLNMLALIAGHKFLTASAIEAPLLLNKALSLLAEAFGHVFLWYGDSSLLDGLSYNFANNLLRGIKRGLIPATCADTVLQWLTTNILACRKLGIGEDSVLATLLMVDVGLDHECTVDNWPPQLQYERKVSGDLNGMIIKALQHARLTKNRMEIAQCLRRQVRLSTSSEEARRAHIEAAELFCELGKKETLSVLADEWRTRFGSSPPALPKGCRH